MAMNRKKFMITGVCLQIIGMIGFGAIFKLDSEDPIIAVAVLLRIIMGIVN